MASKKALGKGLGALISDKRSALERAGGAEGRLRELAVNDIGVNRRQPRRAFAEDDLAELAASIKALGVVQPVVVRPLLPTAPTESDPANEDPFPYEVNGPPFGLSLFEKTVHVHFHPEQVGQFFHPMGDNSRAEYQQVWPQVYRSPEDRI